MKILLKLLALFLSTSLAENQEISEIAKIKDLRTRLQDYQTDKNLNKIDYKNCPFSPYQSPTVVPDKQPQLTFSVRQTVITQNANTDCIRAYLSTYYFNQLCARINGTTPDDLIVADLNNGFILVNSLNLQNVYDNNGNPTEKLIWDYMVTFDYQIFSENCQTFFYQQFLNPKIVSENMKMTNIPTSCNGGGSTRIVVEPNDNSYSFEAYNKEALCSSGLTCDGQYSSDPNLTNITDSPTGGPPLYLKCIPPTSQTCITAECVPACTEIYGPSGITYNKYCNNHANCYQEQDINNAPISPPECSCTSINTFWVYYTGDTCDGKIYLWWFLLIFLVVVIAIVLLLCFCCKKCLCYRNRRKFCGCCSPCCCGDEDENNSQEGYDSPEKEETNVQASDFPSKPISKSQTQTLTPNHKQKNLYKQKQNNYYNQAYSGPESDSGFSRNDSSSTYSNSYSAKQHNDNNNSHRMQEFTVYEQKPRKLRIDSKAEEMVFSGFGRDTECLFFFGS